MTSDSEYKSGDGRGGSHPRPLRQQADAVAERASAAAGSAAEEVKERARSLAEQQKEAGAEQITGVARAVRGAAGELESQLPRAAEYINDAAARLEGAAASLRNRSAEDLLGDVERFARNQPAAFFGGAVLAGLALSRFLKSSSPDTGSQRGH